MAETETSDHAGQPAGAPDPALATDLRRPVELADVAALRDGYSPRTGGIDASRVAQLAEIVDELPPIVVQRATMRVVDGMHRLQAARSRGDTSVPVRYFDGSDQEAYVLAVRLNVVHGMPLPLRDRVAALDRILRTFPEWSDRRIATACGVAPRTVAARRQCSSEEKAQVNTRIGRDGRIHPRSVAAGREVAAELMRRDPGASLRTVARQAGISVGTALDVRRRLARGAGATGADPAATAPRPDPDAPSAVLHSAASRLEQLARDPSVWGSEHGRAVLRLASATVGLMRRSAAVADSMPGHSRQSLRDVAQGCVTGWKQFSERLDSADDQAGLARDGVA